MCLLLTHSVFQIDNTTACGPITTHILSESEENPYIFLAALVKQYALFWAHIICQLKPACYTLTLKYISCTRLPKKENMLVHTVASHEGI